MTRREVLGLFPGTDPIEVERALAAAMKNLGFAADPLERAQVIAILDAMTATLGVVGVAARFAKARALLLPKRPAAPKR